jgi:hypothetical protein
MGMFQMVAWYGTATTWADAWSSQFFENHGVGWSNPMILPVTQGPTDLAVPALQGLNSFNILIFPEPSGFALFSIGLLVFSGVRNRRRSSS